MVDDYVNLINLLFSQRGPSNPSLQTHVKYSPLGIQVAPFSHGLTKQLSATAVEYIKRKV